MNKLCPQFNWHRHGWVVVSIDSSANTVSGFENYDPEPSGAEILGCGQTCCARTYDQNICRLSGQSLKSRQPENPLLGAIFDRSPDIEKGKTELKKDQRISSVVKTPGDPQKIAQQEKPESPVAF